MEKSSRLGRVLLYQSIGFLAIIALCWLDDLMGLASLIFQNNHYVVNYREPALKMLLTLGIWFIVSASTRRILERVRYLEGFLRVCAWCRRIEYKGQWMPLEEFMHQGFDTPTTHGICGECLDVQTTAIKRAKDAKHHEAHAS